MNISLTIGSFFYVCMWRHLTCTLYNPPNRLIHTQPHHARDLKGQAQEFNILAPKGCRTQVFLGGCHMLHVLQGPNS